MLRHTTTDAVKRLLALGLTPGETITLEAIEEVLAPLTRHDRRFATIRQAWITHAFRFHNRRLLAVPGVGVRVLHEHERATEVVKTLGRTVPLLARAKEEADGILQAELKGLALQEAQWVQRATTWAHQKAVHELQKLAARPRALPPTPVRPARLASTPSRHPQRDTAPARPGASPPILAPAP